jgi:uncharacterized protein (DUF58 family)
VRTQSLLARLRRFLRPPRSLKITRTGRTYLVVTVGVGLGALNTGNNLLYLVLGLLLSLIVVSGVLSERCLRDLQIRRVGSDGAYAGEPFAFRWALLRPSGPSFALTIEEQSASLEGTPGLLAYLPRGTELTVRASLTAARRGPHQLTEVKVTTSFPFGIFAKSRIFELEDVLLVYPRRVAPRPEAQPPQESWLGDHGNPRRGGGSGDILGLQELQDGEDARHVHWLKSAAAGRLLRKDREREEQRSFVLQLDPELLPDPLERRCEQLAAVAHQLIQSGHDVGLEAGPLRLRPNAGPGQERRILHALAWMGFPEPAP